MKIVIVNHYAVPPDAGGGTRHFDLASRWAAAGHHVVVLSSSFNHFAGGREAPRLKCGRVQDVVLRPLWTPGYKGNGIARAVDMGVFGLRVLRERALLAGTDIVLASSPHPLGALAALAVTRGSRARLALEIRDLWPETLIDLGGMSADGIPARLLYRLERQLVNGASLVIGVPPGTASYLAERTLTPRRYVHIPNGIDGDTAELSGTAAAADPILDRIDAAKAAGATVFLYAGSLGLANGLEAVIEAAARGQDRGVQLLILGDGPHRERLELLADRLGVENVMFGGRVPKDIARAAMRRASANVFHLLDAPVFRYGLSPNKLVEYLASGTPLLYAGPDTDNPAARSGTAVIARPGDASSISKAMARLSAMSDEERADKARCAQEYTSMHHDLDRLAAVLLSEFEAL